MTTATIPSRKDEIGQGLVLCVLSVLISPLIDIFSKLAVTSVPAAEITFFRLLLQALALAPIVLMRGTLFDPAGLEVRLRPKPFALLRPSPRAMA